MFTKYNDMPNILDVPATSIAPLTSDSCSFAFNPYADIFVSKHIFNIGNCAIIASCATLLILCDFLLYTIITINSMQNDDEISSRDLLRKLKIRNRIVIGYLNINSIRNKFKSINYLIGDNVDIILFSETKLNDTFPDNQFLIKGFHVPYRLDRTDKGGGIMLFVREHTPSRKIRVVFSP